MDQEKALSRDNKQKLGSVLEGYGVKAQLLVNILALYENSIALHEGSTNRSKVGSGV